MPYVPGSVNTDMDSVTLAPLPRWMILPQFFSLEPTVTKLNRRVAEGTREVGSPQSARNKSGSLRSRPPCPSMCHMLTEREGERARGTAREAALTARTGRPHSCNTPQCSPCHHRAYCSPWDSPHYSGCQGPPGLCVVFKPVCASSSRKSASVADCPAMRPSSLVSTLWLRASVAFRAAVIGLTTVETRPRARFVFGLGMLAIVFLDPSGEHRHTLVCCLVRSTQCLSKSHSNVTTKAFHSMDEHQSLVPQIKSFQMTASISWLPRRPVRRPSLLVMCPQFCQANTTDSQLLTDRATRPPSLELCRCACSSAD